MGYVLCRSFINLIYLLTWILVYEGNAKITYEKSYTQIYIYKSYISQIKHDKKYAEIYILPSICDFNHFITRFVTKIIYKIKHRILSISSNLPQIPQLLPQSNGKVEKIKYARNHLIYVGEQEVRVLTT